MTTTKFAAEDDAQVLAVLRSAASPLEFADVKLAAGLPEGRTRAALRRLAAAGLAIDDRPGLGPSAWRAL
ncbi:MAG: hypothetical protein AB7L13_23850 [Acidimicrobiia bacterium]